MNVKSFFAKLAHSTRNPPDSEGLNDMADRLRGKALNSNQLQALFDHLVGLSPFYPLWADINTAILELGLSKQRKVEKESSWMAFDKGKYRYFARMPSPDAAFDIPSGGSHHHRIIPPELATLDREQNQDAARNAFYGAFHEVNKNSDQLERMFTSIWGGKYALPTGAKDDSSQAGLSPRSRASSMEHETDEEGQSEADALDSLDVR